MTMPQHGRTGSRTEAPVRAVRLGPREVLLDRKADGDDLSSARRMRSIPIPTS